MPTAHIRNPDVGAQVHYDCVLKICVSGTLLGSAVGPENRVILEGLQQRVIGTPSSSVGDTVPQYCLGYANER